ncbi:MAG: DNA topoisomerase IV subunit A [Lentisphaerae bacterium]|jgi:topoisomerase IV subunit A|nr:DNA topoisomerase IV subunit A [Lentisphaerota bacterium]MBT5610058.1 DNA topoisomerase IV subunit A [Lentisphaerota bacterium]MBT7055542.1 DNA topoisomerase IV subunit A [Lentisphaerota bacterium]MBT7841503.1 DNA topoisomerase IV subunit A [Lentisphaerota bacterium]
MTDEPKQDENAPQPETDETLSPSDEQAQSPLDEALDPDSVEATHEDTEDALQELMASNYIQYASYVIKERAIPDVNDGLKPVQRRILHALHGMDDGRFHKVANVIGQTMQYHPHGDASIGSALVVLANKDYFIDKQGNFGNIYTGDQASAARYIECRLSPLAREVLFNPEITDFVDSYDGRKQEPVTLPAKVPSLLMMGADGIAVGMTTRVLPHNFCELLEAQIAILRNQPFTLYPDFLTGGTMDVGEYDDGRGKVLLRARIEKTSDKTLVIREIPATTTTESLMNSIEEAAKKGKIKVASINDYTAERVEIEITLPRGVYAKEALQQLYAYTNCEVSVNSNLVVIHENRPVIMAVSEVLRHNTQKLMDDLRRELELLLGKLQDRFHDRTLAQIFIENRIYKRIEECETYKLVLAEVRRGLEKFRHLLRRDITDEDIERLLQLQIRRISRFDINKNREELENILKGIAETESHLAHLKRFTINYIKALLKKYGESYPRRTEITDLETIDVRSVALQNIKVGHDRVGQFVGTDVRNSNKGEAPLVCSEFDRLVVLRGNGSFQVIPIPDKLYVGPSKFLLKADKEQVYSMIYREKKKGRYYAKRFRIDRYIMERDYTTIPKGCVVEAFYTNYGVVTRCEYKPNKRLKADHADVDFDTVEIRSTGARGFKIADHPVKSFTQLKRGVPEPPNGDDNASGDPPENDDGLPPGDSDGDGGDVPATPTATPTQTPPEADTPPVSDEEEDARSCDPGSDPTTTEPVSPPEPEKKSSDKQTGATARKRKTSNKKKAAPRKQSRAKASATPKPEPVPPPATPKREPGKKQRKPAGTKKPAPANAGSSRNSKAREWAERTAKAAGAKSAPATDNASPKQEQTTPLPKPVPAPLRTLIDEETPFFLE